VSSGIDGSFLWQRCRLSGVYVCGMLNALPVFKRFLDGASASLSPGWRVKGLVQLTLASWLLTLSKLPPLVERIHLVDKPPNPAQLNKMC
jgi:hypothetical protein